MGQQGGHETRASADFQYCFVLVNGCVLEHAGFHARRQHDLAMTQRNLHVHKGHGTVGCGDKIFALDHRQQVQHLWIRHVPGADLLFNHVKAGLFDIHRVYSVRKG